MSMLVRFLKPSMPYAWFRTVTVIVAVLMGMAVAMTMSMTVTTQQYLLFCIFCPCRHLGEGV